MRELICFSPHVPYAGIDHAGGAALQTYLDLTCTLGRRVLVAPMCDANLRGRPDHLDQLHLVPPRRTAALTLRDQVAAAMPRFALAPSVRDAFLHDETTVAALRRADVVEYHWQDVARALLPRARTLAPSARHVVYLHDVVSQPLRRSAAGKRGLRGEKARLSARWAEWDESRITAMADCVIVLSEKDRRLLDDRAQVIVQRPLVRVRPATTKRAPGARPRFVFVAAFDRPFNVEAARWLRHEIWPRVREQLPDAELSCAGGGSDTRLDDCLDEAMGITATGYVDDLDAVYANADIALVPLLTGAGVKFKTLEAMTTATPCVSTTIGAEGIDRAADFLEIADTAEEFAAAMTRLARDTSGSYAARAADGARWTADAHGEAQCRSALARAITGE